MYSVAPLAQLAERKTADARCRETAHFVLQIQRDVLVPASTCSGSSSKQVQVRNKSPRPAWIAASLLDEINDVPGAIHEFKILCA